MDGGDGAARESGTDGATDSGDGSVTPDDAASPSDGGASAGNDGSSGDDAPLGPAVRRTVSGKECIDDSPVLGGCVDIAGVLKCRVAGGEYEECEAPVAGEATLDAALGEALVAQIHSQFGGEPRLSASFGRLICTGAAERVAKLLEAHGGSVLCGGQVAASSTRS